MKKDYCTKCGKCCKQIAVDFDNKVMFRDGIQKISPVFEEMLIATDKKENITICLCKYLENNLCTNPQKPEECTNFPSSPFAFLPEDCGYYGDIFIKHENFMQRIRKLKEEILHYETLILSAQKNDAKQYTKIIKQHKNFIDKHKMYFTDT